MKSWGALSTHYKTSRKWSLNIILESFQALDTEGTVSRVVLPRWVPCPELGDRFGPQSHQGRGDLQTEIGQYHLSTGARIQQSGRTRKTGRGADRSGKVTTAISVPLCDTFLLNFHVGEIETNTRKKYVLVFLSPPTQIRCFQNSSEQNLLMLLCTRWNLSTQLKNFGNFHFF